MMKHILHNSERRCADYTIFLGIVCTQASEVLDVFLIFHFIKEGSLSTRVVLQVALQCTVGAINFIERELFFLSQRV